MVTQSRFRVLTMTQCALLALLGLLLTVTPITRADIALIVASASPIASLTLEQVNDLFMGRTRTVDLNPVKILDQARDSAVRKKFFLLLNGMAIARVNAYWARLQFSGEVQPPLALADQRAVLAAVRENPAVLSYVDAALLDPSVRVVFQLKE